VAFGDNHNRWGNTFIGTVGGVPTIFATNGNNSTRVGYAVGAGAEYAFLDNWSQRMGSRSSRSRTQDGPKSCNFL
jgi:opacity protein-like surface antigen